MNNILFFVIFSITILITLQRKPSLKEGGITRSDSTSLKGIAFLMVLFSHIGYFLFPNSNFLFPLSIFAGVGGNLFLFLSGYGLAKSSQDTNPISFYKHRFSKLYVPLVITTIFVVILDLASGSPTSFMHILPGLTAIVPHANIYTDFNSPLWFLTLLFVFYIIFPFIFNREKPFRSSLFLFLFAAIVPGYIIKFLPFSDGVVYLWATHAYAFPLGVACALIPEHVLLRLKLAQTMWLRVVLWCVALFAFIYMSFHAAINTPYEQSVCLITMFLFLYLFLSFPMRSTFILLLGTYSYELYLLHWPLLYRHDVLYGVFPSWLATYLYLFVFLGLGIGIAKISERILHTKKPPTP